MVTALFEHVTCVSGISDFGLAKYLVLMIINTFLDSKYILFKHNNSNLLHSYSTQFVEDPV